MTADSNAAKVLSSIASFRPESLDAYLELYAPSAIAHFLPPGLPPGTDGLRVFYGAFLQAFPDTVLTADEIFEIGDRIVLRFSLRGTHRGDFFGVPATGAPVECTGITILRFEDGRCVERWSESNLAAVMIQLSRP